MGRLGFEVVLLVLIIGVGLYFVWQWDGHRRSVSAGSGAGGLPVQPPADATWRATHFGNESDQTEVTVVLRGPDGQAWDQRRCAQIPNQDPDYDRLFFNAMEDARARAILLNSTRND